MDGRIHYCDTDLDLTSAEDLTALASVLEAKGVFPLHVGCGDDGLWYATFETDNCFDEPDPNIADFITAIESLTEPMRSIWSRCKQREFNFGYECGAEPRSFHQELSSALLGRIAAIGGSLGITIYPDSHEAAKENAPANSEI